VNLDEDVNNQYNETLILNPGTPEEILDQGCKYYFLPFVMSVYVLFYFIPIS
jgi:hypothetical protein